MKYLRVAAITMLALVACLWVASPFVEYEKLLVNKIQAAEELQPIVQQAEVAQRASVLIKAPERVKVGQLVVLDVSESVASSFSWQVMPATDNFMVIEEGKRAIFSAGAGGDFTFIVAAAKGDTVDVKVHKIKVVGSAPTDDLASKIATLCETVDSPTKRDDALKLSQSFSSVAAMIDDTMTPEDVTDKTIKSNRAALGENVTFWHPFLDGLKTELTAMAEAGKLNDAEAHAQAWRAIADGLMQYAQSLE